MERNERPHMIVGVDLGMTCTGVAYVNLSIGSETVRWVQKWPGRFQANENKVPTVVVYPYGTKDPSSWGFLSETAAETAADDKEYKEWFKTCLDPEKLRRKQIEDPEGAPENIQEVEKWYADYLRKMYEYLSFKLGGELAGVGWEEARIEFIFSVPTTWAPIPTVENFKRIVKEAGYGMHPGHVVNIGLTEAEAAAVHVSTEAPGIFRENDVLLVCDAGGGTTDLSVLKVTGTVNQAIDLQQMDVVFGETIGSAAIDYEFERLVMHRLTVAHSTNPLPVDPADAGWEMMKSRDFQAVKCEYGAPDDTPLFSIGIPRVPQTYNNFDPEVRIRNGEMTFEREDLQRLFDKQIAKLFKLIDTQLQSLFQKFPREHVAHLVLSGGLGNSAYVQSQLRKYYARTSFPNAESITVSIAPDPQLAVCKGLVSDRVRKILTSRSVLGWRCCRASYGTVCKIAYDKKNPDHQGKELVRDPLNNKLYITHSIAWFVKKGAPVSVDEPIEHNFVKKIDPGDPRRAFPTTVIESDLEAAMLPDQMNQYTRILCEINSDLSAADERKFQEKNRHFWSIQKHYLRIEYSVRVLIGPADIRFELWFDDQKLSRDESIRVEWLPAPMPQIPQIAELSGAREAVEMSNTPSTPVGAAPQSGAFDAVPSGKAMKTGGFAVVSKRTTGDMGAHLEIMRYLGVGAIVATLLASSAAFDLSPQEVLDSNIPKMLNETTIDPCSLSMVPNPANTVAALPSLIQCIGFYPFPANTDWPKGHATSFSKDIRFTFNDTHYDFDGSRRLYNTFNATLAVAFAPFKHGFINTLGIPNANGDKGGFVYMIGWAGGYQTRAKLDVYYTNAAFAVIKEEDGERKIVEFRESSNIPNTAHLPEPVEWTCDFE
ncbi:actin-like atpase domain-containing protein [Stemphylium lycopersici]|nr:actin-like atpase domain-containing protein [Stemphylium lycopersici]